MRRQRRRPQEGQAQAEARWRSERQLRKRKHRRERHVRANLAQGQEEETALLLTSMCVRHGFARALVPYYPVAGRVAPSSLAVDCTGEGVWFAEAAASCALADVDGLECCPLLIPAELLLPFPPSGKKLYGFISRSRRWLRFGTATRSLTRRSARPRSSSRSSRCRDVDGGGLFHLRRGDGRSVQVPRAGAGGGAPGRRRAPGRLRCWHAAPPPRRAAGGGRLLRQLCVPGVLHQDQQGGPGGGAGGAGRRCAGGEGCCRRAVQDWMRGGVGHYTVPLDYSTAILSDWRRLGFDEVDYGFGVPGYVFPFNDHVNFVGELYYVRPPAPRRGGVRVVLHCVEEPHAAVFASELAKFSQCILPIFSWPCINRYSLCFKI
uniref:Uncharacterized protein n=1 Tax=Avena sativa TaxID=4498 RepID=A0ACD6AIC0_AVESA